MWRAYQTRQAGCPASHAAWWAKQMGRPAGLPPGVDKRGRGKEGARQETAHRLRVGVGLGIGRAQSGGT